MTSALLESDELHLFLLSDDTRIDDNEYLAVATELVVFTEEQMRRLSA